MRNPALLAAFVLPSVFSLHCLAGDLSSRVVNSTETKTIDVARASALNTLRLEHAHGSIAVEGWAKPQVEITFIKLTTGIFDLSDHAASRLLEGVRVSADTGQNAVVIKTEIPKQDEGHIRIEYAVKAPRGMKVEIGNHSAGDVGISGMTGDLSVTTRHGVITVEEPETAHFMIDAHASFGDVYSNFEGKFARHRLLNHDLSGSSGNGMPRLLLRAEYGDIVILKLARPATPLAKTSD